MIIKASIIDPDKLFTFGGLEYQKDLYVLTYGNQTLDSSAALNKDAVTVGLRHKYNFSIVLSPNVRVSAWSDGTDNFTSLDALVTHIASVCFNEGGGDGVGSSAYEVAVTNGFVGTETEWLASLVGADGVAGTTLSLGGSVFCIWAEESVSLVADTYNWSFGNGNETGGNGGVTMAFDCQLIGLGLVLENARIVTLEARINNSSAGKTIVSSRANRKTHVTFTDRAAAYSAGDTVNFRTVATEDNTRSAVLSAWFRIA